MTERDYDDDLTIGIWGPVDYHIPVLANAYGAIILETG